MIYTPLTNKAMKLAYDAHHGQIDAGGIPYIFHPYHLAEQMQDEITTCVALLHDVVEDTSITIDELEGEFPQEVITALQLLTHDPSTDYFDYIQELKDNPVAKAVKVADLNHNTDATRLVNCPNIPQTQRDRWHYKYTRAREILEVNKI